MFSLTSLPKNDFLPPEYNCVLGILAKLKCIMGLSGWHSGKESTCKYKKHRRCGLNPWIRKIPWRRKWQPTPVFLPGKSHGQRSLVGYSPWGCKESEMTESRNVAGWKFNFLNFLELWLCMWHSSVQFNIIINILGRVSNKAVNLIKKGPVSAEIHPPLDLAVEILPKSEIAIFVTILILERKNKHTC